MQQEIEVRFLGVDYDGIRHKLKAAHAQCVEPMHPMKRVIIDYPDQRMQHNADVWGFVRVRDEGDKVMLAYKQVARNPTFDTHEIEVEVSSYDKTVSLLEHIGLKVISEQHTRREVWHLDDTDVSLDDWPWLMPMVELEGPSESALRAAAKTLGLEWRAAMRGNVVNAYRKLYPGMGAEESIRDIPVLTFDIMPDWLMRRQ